MWQGACIAGGHVWQGVCMVGGVHGRGHVWQGACMAGEIATAAGGMNAFLCQSVGAI